MGRSCIGVEGLQGCLKESLGISWSLFRLMLCRDRSHYLSNLDENVGLPCFVRRQCLMGQIFRYRQILKSDGTIR